MEDDLLSVVGQDNPSKQKKGVWDGPEGVPVTHSTHLNQKKKKLKIKWYRLYLD